MFSLAYLLAALLAAVPLGFIAAGARPYSFALLMAAGTGPSTVAMDALEASLDDFKNQPVLCLMSNVGFGLNCS
jgi:hypothetical protein